MYIQLFGWNVRGVNIFSHRRGIRKWIKDNKPLFGGQVETHVKQSKQMKFMNNMLPGWSFEDNYGFPEQGKIWVIWHQSARVRVISKSLQMVSCEVLLPDWQHCCVVSIVYASYDEEL